MKLIYKVALLFIGFATIASCSEDDFFTKPILSVSTSEMAFTEIAGVKSVEVTVNKGDQALYSVIAINGSSDWVTIVPMDDGANISVSANKTQESRQATIKVYVSKGDLSETISVTQAAGTKRIELSEIETEFNYLEHEQSLFVTRSEVETPWTAECVEDWVTLTPDNVKNSLVINIAKNTTTEKRAATITVKSGTLEAKVEITQAGSLYFDFPFLELGYNYEGSSEAERGYKNRHSLITMSEFEEKRGGILVRERAGLTYQYSSVSPAFSNVMYKSTSQGSLVVEEAWLGSTVQGVLDDGKYFEFLEANGFKLIFTHTVTSKLYYWNEDTGIVAICNTIAHPLETVKFIFSHVKPNEKGNQTSTYPAMATIPLLYTGFAKGREEIKEWEASKGSKLNGQDVNVITFTPDRTKEPELIERAYFTTLNGAPNIYHEGLQIFNRVDYGYYPIAASIYEHEMTNEFKALLAKESFVFDGQVRSPSTGHIFDTYFNVERQLLIGPYINAFPDEDMMPRFCLAVFYQKEATPQPTGQKKGPVKVTTAVMGDGFEAIKEAVEARRASK